jgi:uncharacterized membrane protein YdjX (TVP38/TMEM64 family)
MNKPILKLLFLILIAGIGILLFFFFNLQIYFTDKNRAIQMLISCGPSAVPVLICLQIIQVIIAPIPGEATGFLCGYLYGPVMGTVYSTIGLTIGSWIAFMLARLLGMPFVEKAINQSIIEKYDHLMEQQGLLVSFVFFLIPGFSKDALCYIIGLSRMSTAAFLFISTIGRLFGTILLSVFASSVRNGQHEILLIVSVMSGILLLFSYIYRERLLAMLKVTNK